MSAAVSQPVFARVLDRLSATAEAAGEGAHRRELPEGLSGRVFEVGAGNGLNFKHFPTTVTSVLAVEPEDYLRQRATEQAARVNVPIEVVDALAEALPAEDESFDAAVASIVLCSVPDQPRAGGDAPCHPPGQGTALLRAHPRQRPAPRALPRRDWPGWRVLGGGCHPDRVARRRRPLLTPTSRGSTPTMSPWLFAPPECRVSPPRGLEPGAFCAQVVPARHCSGFFALS